jgi:hypothetical protein
MKDSKTLLLEYLASVRDPERAASLFAEDGAFELPFLRSLGVAPRHAKRSLKLLAVAEVNSRLEKRGVCIHIARPPLSITSS